MEQLRIFVLCLFGMVSCVMAGQPIVECTPDTMYIADKEDLCRYHWCIAGGSDVEMRCPPGARVPTWYEASSVNHEVPCTVDHTAELSCLRCDIAEDEQIPDDDDDCANSPCSRECECQDLWREYFCLCPDNVVDVAVGGYAGRPNYCDPNKCKNNAKCWSQWNDYWCECPKGYTGKNCEVSFCDSNPCHNDGTCVIDEVNYHCLCAPGYGGSCCDDRDDGENRTPVGGGSGITATTTQQDYHTEAPTTLATTRKPGPGESGRQDEPHEGGYVEMSVDPDDNDFAHYKFDEIDEGDYEGTDGTGSSTGSTSTSGSKGHSSSSSSGSDGHSSSFSSGSEGHAGGSDGHSSSSSSGSDGHSSSSSSGSDGHSSSSNSGSVGHSSSSSSGFKTVKDATSEVETTTVSADKEGSGNREGSSGSGGDGALEYMVDQEGRTYVTLDSGLRVYIPDEGRPYAFDKNGVKFYFNEDGLSVDASGDPLFVEL